MASPPPAQAKRAAKVAKPAKAARPTPWRTRLDAWWSARHPLQDHCQLGQRNIYILPSRPGWAFAATLALILLASINEQLSLGYLLCFALAGAGLVAMHSTQGNLRGLQLSLRPPPLAAANEPVPVVVQIHNPGPARYGLQLQWVGSAATGSTSDICWTDVPAQGQVSVLLQWTPPGRGLHRLPGLRIRSSFPLGLYRCWSRWRPAAQACVYPQAERPLPPWPLAAGGSHSPPSPAHTGGKTPDWAGVRAWRAGDSPRQVLWRKAAQRSHPGADLPVREQDKASSAQLHFSWQQVSDLGQERALSRLCAWVLAAEQQQARYALHLPAGQQGMGQGPEHLEACLRLLAMHGLPPREGAA